MKDRVVLAYSGGLDTTVAISWIAKERNAEVITRINADIKEMQEDGTMMELSMKWFNLDQVTI